MDRNEIWVIADELETAKLFVRVCVRYEPPESPNSSHPVVSGMIHWHVKDSSKISAFFYGFRTSSFEDLCGRTSFHPNIKKVLGLVFVDCSQDNSQFRDFLEKYLSGKSKIGGIDIKKLPFILVSIKEDSVSTQPQYDDVPMLRSLSLPKIDKNSRGTIVEVG